MIATEDHDRVRVVRLQRPEARNALDGSLRGALIQALEEAQADDGVGAIVITGTGKAFAAGADLRELLERDAEAQRAFLQPPHIYSVVEGLRKPVVAAVNGHALGAGLELATACDARVAHPKAKLGQPEVNLALMPGGGGTQRLVRLVGRGHAARLVLGGDPVPAHEAQAMGLIEAMDEDPVGTAVAWAQRMARHDPEALAAAKASLQDALAVPYAEGLEQEIERFVALHGREAARKRIRAFLES